MSESVRRNLAELHKTERDQWQLIRESQARGHAKSIEHSPVRAALIEGRKPFEQDIAERVAQREEEVNQQSNRYWNARRNMLDKIHNRKPIFSLKEVAKAQADLEVQKQNHKKQLQEDERKMWEHLTELNYAVLDRPLLMESGNPARPDSPRRAAQALARRPPRPKSAPNTREQKSELWGDLREEIHSMVESTIAVRSGKSFQQRLSESVSKKLREMEETEQYQWRIINESLERGRAKSVEASSENKRGNTNIIGCQQS